MNFNLRKMSSLLFLAAMMMPVHSFAQTDAGLQTATFEDLPLEKESFWNGSDLTGSFTSGSFKFINTYTPAWASWYGFSYANLTTTDFTGYTDNSQYANAFGGGYDGSANYVTTYVSSFMGKTTMEVVNPAEEGNVLTGFYVTNSACTMEAINNGLAPARAFEQGDWLMLTITEPTTGKKVEYYLADYRSENAADHYALDTWQWVDLSELGNVKTLEFDITGTDNGDYGINTPTYFCMDNFNGSRVITEAPAQVVEPGSSIDLAQFFTFDNNEASVVYTVDEVSEGCTADVTVNGSSLEISGNTENAFNVVVKAVKKGKVYFVSIPCTEKLATATFEEHTLESESFWNGSDLTGSFTSGAFRFINSYTPDWASWYGFAYANLTSTDFNGYTDNSQYANAFGRGYDESANYAVVYLSSFMGKTSMEVINPSADGDMLRGFYVTNSACTMEAINNGLAPARAFEQGDWLMLTITEPTTGKKVEYYLVDYRSENAADHYALDTWQWVDLSELGNVKTLEFDITGTDNGDYGINTPTYFCMDNFNGYRVITEAPAQVVEPGSSIDLAQFFTFDNNEASVVYTVDEMSEGCTADVTVNGSNLEISGNADCEFNVVVKAVKKGKIYFVNIPVTVGTGIEGAEAADNYETEVYTVDGMRVNNKVNGVNIIRTNNGKVKKVLVK